MKIVHTPARFFPFVGGVEKYVHELAKEQVKQGHDVTVVCASEPEEPGEQIVDGIKVIRLKYVTKVANTNITPSLFATLMKLDFDVIHTHMPTPWSADISALVSTLRCKRLIVTYHNDLNKSGGVEKLIATIYSNTLLKLMFLQAWRIIITQPRYLEYSKYLQKFATKVSVVPLGVSKPIKTKFTKDPNKLFFLSVLDRHHEYKGLDVLLRSMVQVAKTNKKIHLYVGGKGEMVGQYRALCKELRISKHVTFLGYVSDADLSRHYAESAAFILPSVDANEGFGIVALEAMSYGTAVITTDIVGSAEFIRKHEAGIVVPPCSVDDLCLAISTICADPKSQKDMGIRGGAAVRKEFDWADIAKDMCAQYSGIGGRKLFQVSAYYPPHIGGQEYVVQDLSNALAKYQSKYEVIVVTSSLGSQPGVRFEGDVLVIRLRALEFAHTAIIWRLLPWLIRNTDKGAVIHLHVGQAFTPEVVWLASKIRKFKYILELHIDPMPSGSVGVFLGVYKRLILYPIMQRSDKVLVLNSSHFGKLLDDGIDRDKIRIVSNGIDEVFFASSRSRTPQDIVRLVFVGRLSPQKNLFELIKAIHQMHGRASLCIVGDGELRDEIITFINDRAITNVDILGAQLREKVAMIYREFDALILPSLYEAQPLVLLEAMAANLTILASDVEGVREHVKGRGLLFQPNAESIAQCIDDFINNSHEAELQLAHEYAMKLRWSTLMPVYGSEYDKLFF